MKALIFQILATAIQSFVMKSKILVQKTQLSNQLLRTFHLFNIQLEGNTNAIFYFMAIVNDHTFFH